MVIFETEEVRSSERQSEQEWIVQETGSGVALYWYLQNYIGMSIVLGESRPIIVHNREIYDSHDSLTIRLEQL